MIDPGKLYDWLDKRDIDLTQWMADGEDTWGEKVTRQEWEALFRQYIAELTSSG